MRHGHVRYAGVSNWAVWQIVKALGIAERLGLSRFESLHAYYTAAGRGLKRKLVPMLPSEGLGLIEPVPIQWRPLNWAGSRGIKDAIETFECKRRICDGYWCKAEACPMALSPKKN